MPTGNRRLAAWTAILRVTLVCGLVALPVVIFLPETAPLTGFWLFSLWVNGPISFLFPGAYEPVLMMFGAAYPPVLVAVVGVSAVLYIEYVNYRLYDHLLAHSSLQTVTTGRGLSRMVRLFNRSPFLTLWLCGIVLPFWPMRIISPLAGYPMSRHLAALALGRFPRLFFFASLGSVWHFDQRVLLLVAILLSALGFTVWLTRKRAIPVRVREER